MNRVSGWYARRAKAVLFALGVGLAATVNLDLMSFSDRILTDQQVRADLVRQAEDRVAQGLPAGRPGREGDPVDAEAVISVAEEARATLDNLPGRNGAGFGRVCDGATNWHTCFIDHLSLSAVLSWILIGLGCMMGGQFWYDLMGAVLRFRPATNGLRKTG